MNLYKKDNIEISLIEENDINAVLKLFDSFDFNVNLDTGVRPSTDQFESIIRSNMNKDEKLETVLVLKKDGEVIGYLSCFIDYSMLTIGHIAVKKSEQHQGYGRILTYIAMLLASSSNRNVSCVCYHKNKYLKQLGFETRNNVCYYFQGRLDCENIPDIFVSLEEYKRLKQIEMDKELESFKKFLESDIGKHLLSL